MRKAIAIVSAVAVITLSGCARKSAGTIDAPVAGNNGQDNSPAQIINMPNAWRNIATKCDVFQKGYRIYETRSNSNSNSNIVIVPDVGC
jgi:hypothetical protein